MIAARSAGESVGNLRADDVQHEQWRYRKSERKLRQLPDWQPQIAADVDRPKCVENVNRERCGEHVRSGFGSPERHKAVEHPFGELQRYDQGNMTGEVAEHEREQHQRTKNPRTHARTSRATATRCAARADCDATT